MAVTRRIAPENNTVLPRFNFTEAPAATVVYANRDTYAHEDATRRKQNAVNADKFNEFERVFYKLADVLGDLETGFEPSGEDTTDILTLGDKLRDINNFVNIKLSLSIISTYLRIILGSGVIKRFGFEYLISKRGPASDMDVMIETGTALTPDAFSFRELPSKLTFGRAPAISFEGSNFGLNYENATLSDIAGMPVLKVVDDPLSSGKGMVFVGHKFIKKFGLYETTSEGTLQYTALLMEAGNKPPLEPNYSEGGSTINRAVAYKLGTVANDDFYTGSAYADANKMYIDTYNGVIRNINKTTFTYVYVFYNAYAYRVDAIGVGAANESQGVPYIAAGNPFLPSFIATPVYTPDISTGVITDVTIETDYDLSDYTDIIDPYETVAGTGITELTTLPVVQESDLTLYYFLCKATMVSSGGLFGTPGMEQLPPEGDGWYTNYKSSMSVVDDIVDVRKYIDAMSVPSHTDKVAIRSANMPVADNMGNPVPLVTNFITAISGMADTPDDQDDYDNPDPDNEFDRLYEFYYHMNGEALAVDQKKAYIIHLNPDINEPDETFNYHDEVHIKLQVSLGAAIPESELSVFLHSGHTATSRTVYLPALAEDEVNSFYISDDGSTFYDVDYTQIARLNPTTAVNQDADAGYGIKSDHIQKQAVNGSDNNASQDIDDSSNKSTAKSNTSTVYPADTVDTLSEFGHIKTGTVGATDIKPAAILNNHFADSILNAIKLVPESIIRTLLSKQAGYMITHNEVEVDGLWAANIKRVPYQGTGVLDASNIQHNASFTIRTKANDDNVYDNDKHSMSQDMIKAARNLSLSSIPPGSYYNSSTGDLVTSGSLILSGAKCSVFFSYPDRETDEDRDTTPYDTTYGYAQNKITITAGTLNVSAGNLLVLTFSDKTTPGASLAFSALTAVSYSTYLTDNQIVIGNVTGGASPVVTFINGQQLIAYDKTNEITAGSVRIGYTNGAHLRRCTMSTGSPTTKGTAGDDLTLENGEFSADKVWNAVWNDYADFQELADAKYVAGKCYYQTEKGARLTTERCQMGVLGIATDTFGHAVGVDKSYKRQVPIGVSGFVLAHIDKVYPAGTPLTCGPNGVLTEISMEEKRDYPERIVAVYHKDEKRKLFGTTKTTIKVGGRKWVKIK